MHQRFRKVFVCIVVFLLLAGIVSAAYGRDYYPVTYRWWFQNSCYLGFNQAINFTNSPHQGVFYDSSLVGYWNMNEGSGGVAHDSSGNGNNGTLYGYSNGTIQSGTWVAGKYGNGLSFDGRNNYVGFWNSSNFNIGTNNFTISLWLRAQNLSSTVEGLIIKRDWSSVTNSGFQLQVQAGGNVWLYLCDGSAMRISGSSAATVIDNIWHNVVLVGNRNSNATFYVDGMFSGSIDISSQRGSISNNVPLIIGADDNGNSFFNGVIDEACIYNRVLSAAEVAELYAMNPYARPDPILFANYYNFTDPVTNNSMLIHIDNPSTNSNNVALVTCTNFFVGNSLAFQSNNSATVNVWTNLGQPAFTTGVWNSENCTTTLTLDAFSTAELNWNTYKITTFADAHSSVSPSNVTVGYGGSQTLSFNASQGYRFNVSVDGVSQGQISTYIFDTVTAPHTVNVVSTPLTYTITASADAHSTITPGNVSVNYGGSQQFNMTADSGYYISHVYVDGVDQGNLTTYSFTNVQDNHTISVTSAVLAPTNTSTPTTSPTPSPSISPSPSPNPTASPAPSQTPQPTTSPFPTETAVIAVIAVATLIAGFALAFKKGYITIEVVDEENPQENQDDYTI
jgi:hypothetical protein